MTARALQSRRGFTLVEILAATSVMVILAMIIAQITSAVNRTTSLSHRAIDAATQARLAFDRIGMDLEGAAKRSDLDFFTQNTTGTAPLLQFVATVPSAAAVSSSNNRGLSVVTYQVAPHTDNQSRTCLVRSGKAIGWTNTGGLPSNGFIGLQADGLPLAFTSAGFDTYRPKTADFDVLAEGVIRMVIAFQLYPDNQSVRLADGTKYDNARGQLVYSPPVRSFTSSQNGASVDYVDPSRISALVIGVVALDSRTLRLLDAAQITALAGVFDLPSAQVSPLQAWSATADKAATDTRLLSVPLPARQAVRVFERCYPLTPYAMQPL